jgi:phage tail sheath gpL-like
MSSSISFNGIPASIRVPGVYVEIDASRAIRGLSAWPARVLIAGQRLATGTAPAGVPVRLASAGVANGLFGRGSMLAAMCAAWFRANTTTEVWALPINDLGAGVQATGTLTFAGTATAAGTVNLLIAGQAVPVGIASGNTAAQAATAAAAAINAAPDLPVTAAAAAAVVTLTARHRGIEGNGIDLRHSFQPGEALPAGLTLTIVGMASGTGNPDADLGTALDALGDAWFTDLVSGWSAPSTLAVIEARLLAEWGPLRMRDCHAWAGRREATFAALATFGAARNSPFVTVMGFRGSPTPSWQWAAALAGVAVFHLAIDPARQVRTLALPGVIAPPIAERFSWAEREQLLRDGIATFEVARDGQVLIERAITTYQTNAAGAEDESFLDVETMKLLAFLRFDLRQMVASRYPRHKLADDGTSFARGQAVVTPGLMRAEIIARALQWEAQGLVENIEQLKRDLVVIRNPNDPNRLDALIPPDVVNNLRVLAAQIQFLL